MSEEPRTTLDNLFLSVILTLNAQDLFEDWFFKFLLALLTFNTVSSCFTTRAKWENPEAGSTHNWVSRHEKEKLLCPVGWGLNLDHRHAVKIAKTSRRPARGRKCHNCKIQIYCRYRKWREKQIFLFNRRLIRLISNRNEKLQGSLEPDAK